MRESVVTFGARKHLVGVVTEPESRAGGVSGRPAFMLLNVGMLHRIGPFRMSVDLARRLAKEGYRCLRFDVSGQGDSIAGGDEGSNRDQAAADAREAMSFLAGAYGEERFVLWGLCTGADYAHATAIGDARVCGSVFVEGYAYRTARFFWRRYVPFLTERGKLARYVVFRFRRKRGAPAGETPEALPYVGDEAFGWDLPARSKTRADLRQLLARDARLLYIFSGDSQTRSRYNYAGQLQDSMRPLVFGDRIQEAFIREGDHIFSQLHARERMITIICEWMQKQFGQSRSHPPFSTPCSTVSAD